MVMSIDGFIADVDGVTVSGPDDWVSLAETAKNYKNFVIGRGTNRKGGLDNIDCEYKVMVSSHPYDKAGFIHATSPEEAMRLLKDRVETVYLVGGGKLNASFAKSGLIDELVVTIIPRVIGDGTRLFGENGISLDLKLLRQEALHNGNVRIIYKVNK